MDETKTSNPSPEKPTDKDYKKKRVEEIGSTLAQIKARVKANRSCVRKEDDSKSSPREILSEKSEKYIQVLELDKYTVDTRRISFGVLPTDGEKSTEEGYTLPVYYLLQYLVPHQLAAADGRVLKPVQRFSDRASIDGIPRAKAQKLEKERPKIKEAIENLMIDRENQKLVEKKIEETRAKQSAPLPEIPTEIQKRISDLEITVHNLKETLSEKERVLESKTESWRLLSDQLEQRNIEVVERYEIMAKEIDEVKRSYSDQEVFLRQELEKYKSKLQDADSLLISQENSRQDHGETVAELEALRNTHAECESKFGEYKRSQESEKKLILKLKAQIKNYRNEINSKKDLSAEVDRLKNQIATLEDEKGNHLLQLVDFDEYKESALKNQDRVKELESALKSIETEFNLSKEQCIRLNEDYKELCSKLNEKEGIIGSLKESLEKMEQSKISSEFKAAELEEKLEAENREDRAQNDKMCKEIDNLKCHVKQQEEMVEELRNLIVQKEDEINSIKDNREIDYSYSYGIQDLKDLLDEWKLKYNQIEENVRIVEEEKETLSIKVQSLQTKLEAESNRCQNITMKLTEKESAINDYIKANSELIESLSKSNEKIAELQKAVSCNIKTETKTDDQTQKLKKLAANLKIKVKLCKELEEKVTELNEKLSHHENNIAILTNEKSELENANSEYKIKLENVSLDTEVVEQLKNLISEKEIIIQRLTEQQGIKLLAVEAEAMQRARRESQCELTEMNTTIKHLKEENLLLESKLNENLMEIHSVEETKVGEASTDRNSKDKIILELENTICDLKSQLEEANMINSEAKIKLDEQSKLIDELKDELNVLKQSQDLTNSELSVRNDLIDQIKMLQTELESSRKVITDKEEMITSFEQEMNLLKSEINQNESQLAKIQELYVEESSRNDSVITNIQSLEEELNFSKNEILSLSEQLTEVSNNYELCMHKLKEKDSYIDNLEKQLEATRNKLQNLESVIEERQKAMEERAKQLGDKLNQASSVSLHFEQYRLEMEQKFLNFDITEKQLNSKINELTQQLEQEKVNGDELLKEKESNRILSDNKIKELELELNDIKCAYNTTLDQIEILNGELNQVMAQIEHRNTELVRIGEERNSLIGRLGEVEDTCTDLRSRLQLYEEQSETLKNELDSKLKELDVATTEITNLQAQLGMSQVTDSIELTKELEILKNDYEEKLRELQVEKNDLLKVVKGTVAPEVDSLMKAAEDQVDKKEEIQLFSWGGHTESSPFDDTHEDSWGWNASEAKLEEEYQNSEANKIKQIEGERDRMKMENDNLLEEVKSLKIKCTKLVSKVKGLKAASEKEKNKTGFEDLNFVMQEEFRSQVDEIDKKNKDLQCEISSMKIEKERLLKRVETLTSANNQLIEMKERQDIELQVWQRNCCELKNQLAAFDWTDETKAEVKSAPIEVYPKSNSALEDKLAFLETENEELLQIICTLKDEKQASNNAKTELDNLKEEYKTLKNKQDSSKVTETLTNELKLSLENEKQEVQNKILVIQQLTDKKSQLESRLDTLNKDFKENQEQYNALLNQTNNFSNTTQQIDEMKIDLESKLQTIAALTENLHVLQDTINRLNEENAYLKTLCNEKDEELSKSEDKVTQINFAVKQVESLQSEQTHLSNEIDRLKQVVQALTDENENLRTTYDTKVGEVELLKADMLMTEASKNATISELQCLREEFNKISQQNAKEIIPTVGLFDTPQASSVFGSSADLPIFKTVDPVNELVVASHVTASATAPVSISQNKNRNQFNQNFVSESPPVFKGFFSDNFSSSNQNQFDISGNVFDVFPPGDAIDSITEPSLQVSEKVDSTELESLKQKIIRLEQENFTLKKQIDESQAKMVEFNLVAQRISEKENEIKDLHIQMEQLSITLNTNKQNFDSEKNELNSTNRTLSEKLHDYENSVENYQKEINQLKWEITEVKNQQVSETERMKNTEEIRKQETSESERSRNNDLKMLQERMEEQMRQNERNFQNILLNKDEENAHLVCEISAKQAACDKLMVQIETLQSQLNSIENELKNAKVYYQSEINSLKENNDRLNFENTELKKIKENDSQLFAAQVDYLQQSCREKDFVVENVNIRCGQLTEELSRLQEEVRISVERSSHLEGCYNSLIKSNEEQTNVNNSLQERLREANTVIEELNIRVSTISQECNSTITKLELEKSSQESLHSKEADQISLLTSEIESLQSAITEKDLEIERLSKLLTGLQERLVKAEESKISDEVLRLRGKLDEALYTLHLRDVKCDELTVEIMQLLEERDSLQLRLSEAIRSNECLKTSVPSENQSLSPSLTESKSSHDLNNKIGELHTGYMKDPAVREDRESRYTQQMHLFTSDEPGTVDSIKQEPASSDYGIFNWFFSSSTSPQPSQEPAT